MAMNEGELWSLMRSSLRDGVDIRADYDAGKYPNYEHYSARLDAAAATRANDVVVLFGNHEAEAIARLRVALLDIAKRVEALKRDCGMDPESAQALRNGQYMSIALAARAAADA